MVFLIKHVYYFSILFPVGYKGQKKLIESTMLTFNNQKYQTGNRINPVHSGISFKGQQRNDLSSWLAETPIAERFPDLNNAGRTPAEGRWVTHRGRRNLTNRLRFIYYAIHLLCKLDPTTAIFCFFGRFWFMLDSQTKLLLFNVTNIRIFRALAKQFVSNQTTTRTD